MQMKWKLMEDAISFMDKLKLAKFSLTTNQFTNGKKVRELEEEWNKWLEINKEMVEEEIKRTNDLGYKECVKEKMFNAGRYYFRKRGSAPLTPTQVQCDTNIEDFAHETNKKELLEIQNKPKELLEIKPNELLEIKPKEKVKVRTYIKLNEYVLTTIDNNIIKYMDNEDYTPAYGHAQFCINNKELLYNEFMNFQKNNIEMDIQNYLKKIKITYKNRYFLLGARRGFAPLKPH